MGPTMGLSLPSLSVAALIPAIHWAETQLPKKFVLILLYVK